MKILLLHPEDSLWEGPWAELAWDLVVDFGWAGRPSYQRWSQRLGCPVLSLYDFGRDIETYHQMNSIMSSGYGRLLDREGLDWWEIMSNYVRGDLLTVLLVLGLAEHLGPARGIVVTRPSKYAKALGILLGMEVKSFRRRNGAGLCENLKHYASVVATFSPPQLIEIALDKWDPAYVLRRLVSSRSRHIADGPLVLLPSPYVNVSRTVLEYARMLPHRRFLLVATRRSGRLVKPPSNVRMASLASYASSAPSPARERPDLTKAWNKFKKDVVTNVKELTIAEKIGVFSCYPALFAHGLAVRDIWRNVFDSETIDAVLCGDENNPFTRIPVILGKKRGVRTVYCHHGALDVNQLFRESLSDIYLAKGGMEKDYLITACRLLPEKIVVGAPEHGVSSLNTVATVERGRAPSIVYFSEPYELYSGRVKNIYEELLPPLCGLARQTGRNVIVKLHPYESIRGRARVIDRALSPADRPLVNIVDTPLSASFLRDVWFGITVESSVAVECTLQGVPCFLCGWLELGAHGYVRQYAKYGAGYVLESPGDIERIPELLQGVKITPHIRQGLWQPITPKDLDRLLSGSVCSVSDSPVAVKSQITKTHYGDTTESLN